MIEFLNDNVGLFVLLLGVAVIAILVRLTIQSNSLTTPLKACVRRVRIGNSLERSYLRTAQKVLIVCAGVPSGHLGLTGKSLSLNPDAFKVSTSCLK
jgi:hypothetical protein